MPHILVDDQLILLVIKWLIWINTNRQKKISVVYTPECYYKCTLKWKFWFSNRYHSVSNLKNYTDSGLRKPKEATGIWIKYEQRRRLENELDANCFVTVCFTTFSSSEHGLGNVWYPQPQRKSSKQPCYKLDNYFLEMVLVIPYSYPVYLAHY